jgi:hypothetical protein
MQEFFIRYRDQTSAGAQTTFSPVGTWRSFTDGKAIGA